MSDLCFAADQGLITLDEALARLLAEPLPAPKTESVHIRAAQGRILAEDLRSPFNVPGHDNSAMDGYAVHSSDLSSNADTRLPITQRIPAGSIGTPLPPGACARIFTGAPIPPGADAVVMQEQVETDGEFATMQTHVKPGENVRRAGNDIATDSLVMEQGAYLGPAHIGLIASLGLSQIKVFVRPKVAILSTGDELLEPGEPLEPGKIYNSNRYTLWPLLEGLGCEPIDLGRVEDTLKATIEAFEKASATADVIISTGGVSVGEEDHVRAAVQALGQLDMWRIAVKPGKPFAFGRVKNALFIGLPGNPVSVFVTSLLLARPVLLRLMGASKVTPTPMEVPAGFTWKKATPRREYLRVQLQPVAGQGICAVPHQRQTSDVLSSTIWADGLAEVPEHTSLSEGDPVRYYPLANLLKPE